jgi:hypothetical protein
MKNIQIKRLFIALVVILFLSIFSVNAQDKQFFFGGSKAFEPDSIGNTFSFSFNRTESTDVETGPLQKVWEIGKGALVLRPSASADLGSLTGVAENNILINLSLGFHRALHKGLIFITEFAPSYVSDKNFHTGLLFGEITPKLAYRYFDESKAEHFIIANTSFDIGNRLAIHSSPDNFMRIIPGVSYKLAIVPITKEDSAKKSKFSYFRWTFNLDGKVFIMKGDESIISDGSYGYFSGAIDYRFTKNIAISLKYVKGNIQPTFKQVNAVSIGFSIYQ